MPQITSRLGLYKFIEESENSFTKEGFVKTGNLRSLGH